MCVLVWLMHVSSCFDRCLLVQHACHVIAIASHLGILLCRVQWSGSAALTCFGWWLLAGQLCRFTLYDSYVYCMCHECFMSSCRTFAVSVCTWVCVVRLSQFGGWYDITGLRGGRPRQQRPIIVLTTLRDKMTTGAD
jgi:hypothetical protein